jgi:hypothetical protein
LTESREDHEQEIQGRGALLDHRLCWSGKNGEEVRGRSDSGYQECYRRRRDVPSQGDQQPIS